HAMVGVNVFAADTDAEARRLFTSLQQQVVNPFRGTPTEIPPPVERMEGRGSPAEEAQVYRMTQYSVVGSPETVRARVERTVAETGGDEMLVPASSYGHAPRLRSFEIAAGVFRQLAASSAAALPA